MCDEKTKEKVAYKIIGLVASTPDTQISIESEKKVLCDSHVITFILGLQNSPMKF